uniref:Uncharacterized protein n=1 Tax=Apteryx owenii TaxID=8824 RepID=A0A8B9NUZ6_APTOW
MRSAPRRLLPYGCPGPTGSTKYRENLPHVCPRLPHRSPELALWEPPLERDLCWQEKSPPLQETD